ncbi:MAG TPA: carbohydrate binding domain-containing protein, partial [Rheinheimera sp.]|nr:carbohydrate binding domain-containing protein [Rheinheimera sp.]
MRKIVPLCAFVAFAANTAFADVENGSFEQWSGNTPAGWSLIDSGIALTPASNIVKNGTKSAAISVNTADQAATDFRQTVSVTAGQSYSFSVAVYHTEGNVKARLYVNGYQGYSNENLTGQWQTLSHSYTASTSGSIEVGLRFYDLAGFDGSEVVYVDDFQPSVTPVEPPPAGCAATTATFAFKTDSYASESSWQLVDGNNQQAYANGSLSNNTSYTEQWCLADGDYSFTISDS